MIVEFRTLEQALGGAGADGAEKKVHERSAGPLNESGAGQGGPRREEPNDPAASSFRLGCFDAQVMVVVVVVVAVIIVIVIHVRRLRARVVGP